MPSILCVEDEKDLREDVVDVLRENGYETFEAANGREGMDVIRREGPDLVLCDITMPVMNGFQLLENLREKYPQYAETPFIFLSALADRKDVVAGKQLGADDYLTKPVDFNNLHATIQSRLAQVERMKEHKQKELGEIREEIMLLLPHEMRTPLNHIIGFSEILKEQCFGPIGNEKYLEYAHEIHDAGLHMKDTVMNILTLADIATGRSKPVREACKVASCVEEIACFHAHQAERAELELVSDISNDTPLACGDRPLICQALSALVSNAIKFSLGKGQVVILSMAGKRDGWVQLEVRDQGIGMSRNDIDEALKPFSQIDKGMSRRFEGLGLGLAMANAAMESMAGKLLVASAPDRGTTATMLLPEWNGNSQ